MAVGVLLSKAKEMGYSVTFGEAYRTPEQAAWNAARGIGIGNSLHTRRLAVDLNFFKSGIYITDGSRLADLGAWWKAQGPMYCWGGDFPSHPDGNHFSLSPDGKVTQ